MFRNTLIPTNVGSLLSTGEMSRSLWALYFFAVLRSLSTPAATQTSIVNTTITHRSRRTLR